MSVERPALASPLKAGDVRFSTAAFVCAALAGGEVMALLMLFVAIGQVAPLLPIILFLFVPFAVCVAGPVLFPLALLSLKIINRRKITDARGFGLVGGVLSGSLVLVLMVLRIFLIGIAAVGLYDFAIAVLSGIWTGIGGFVAGMTYRSVYNANAKGILT